MGNRKVGECFFCALIFCAVSVVLLVYIDIHISIRGLLIILSLVVCVVSLDIARLDPADSHSLKSLITQYIILRLMCFFGRRVYNRIDESCGRLRKFQEELLLKIVIKNKETEYGKRLLFENISNRKGYTTKVPLTNYSDYDKYIERIKQGKENVLTKDKVVYLALSSGTTGPNKVIPVTGHMKGPAAMMVGPIMYYTMNKQCGGISLGRVLVLSFRAKLRKIECGLEMGPVSEHMGRHLPFLLSPQEVSSIPNENAAMHVHAVIGLKEPEVSRIEGLMSTVVYSFWNYITANWKMICTDIEKGQIDPNIPIEPSIRANIEQNLSPDPYRADMLRVIFSVGFERAALNIWPKLQFARMLTSGAFKRHAELLKETFFKDVPYVSQAHAASEGFMGFNLNNKIDKTTYTPLPGYAFYEYIREDHVSEEQPKTYFIEEVKIGENYEVVMTTPMGLYRYRTGDVIKVTSFHNQAPVYEYQYRLGQILNVTWEKCHELTLYESVTHAINTIKGTTLIDFSATESSEICKLQGGISSSPSYTLFIEMQGPKLSEDAKRTFDKSLCDTFELYSTLRESGSIEEMQVIQVKEGTFIKLKAAMTATMTSLQYKVPRVLRNHKHLKVLLEESMK